MITVFLLIVAVIFLIAQVVGYGVNKTEINECNQWQKMAKDYPDFYLTTWQAQQCIAHGIKVEAPVVKTPSK